MKEKTVLFVSHNLQAIEVLCNKGFLFQRGHLINAGTTQDLIQNYIHHSQVTLNNSLQQKIPLYMDYTLDTFDVAPGQVCIGQSVDFSLSITRSDGVIKIDELALLIYSMSGVRLAVIDLRHEVRKDSVINTSQLLVSGCIDRIPFVEGEYSIGLYVKILGFSKNFPDLIKLIVKQDKSAAVVDGVVTLPYVTRNLGLVDLNYSVGSSTI